MVLNMNRRKFLRKFSISAVAAGAVATPFYLRAKESMEAGVDLTAKELTKLKEDYEKLDNKVKILTKLLLASSGLDIFLSI